VRVVVPNPKHTLKADMFANIRVALGIKNAFILPSTAVLHEGDKTYVFIANAQGKFDQRSVTVGNSFDSGGVKSIEVLSGLNDGEKVVTVGGALLRPASGE
jgi:cobalt-zinc-cadmium efflux system membrane fusion protein